MKGILRFALVSLLAMVLTPQLSRVFDQLAQRVPADGFWRELLTELSDKYAGTIVKSLGQAVGDIVLGG